MKIKKRITAELVPLAGVESWASADSVMNPVSACRDKLLEKVEQGLDELTAAWAREGFGRGLSGHVRIMVKDGEDRVLIWTLGKGVEVETQPPELRLRER